MEQLNLFENQLPVLPRFEHLSWYADRSGIETEKSDRKNVIPLLGKCIDAIRPMMEYQDRMTLRHGLDEYISPDYFLFYVADEQEIRRCDVAKLC